MVDWSKDEPPRKPIEPSNEATPKSIVAAPAAELAASIAMLALSAVIVESFMFGFPVAPPKIITRQSGL